MVECEESFGSPKLHLTKVFPEFFKLFFSFNFILKNVLEQNSIPISNLCQAILKLSHYISYVCHWFFFIVTILFILTCWRVVNPKSNFVFCHSYSHICYLISSMLHRFFLGLCYLPVYGFLTITHSLIYLLIYMILTCLKCFICLPSSYLVVS